MNNLLFTYGTLKLGGTRHGVLKSHRSRLFSDGWTERADLVLHRTDRRPYGFPVPLPSAKGLPIYGELYEITENVLPTLDHIEALGSLYTREMVRIRPNMNGPVYSAWMYIGIPQAWQETAHNVPFPLCTIKTIHGTRCWIFEAE
jgi:gamma-glutamylcyclotransferase (GGCT)/AIG2-like uncharacterized protein YtfP